MIDNNSVEQLIALSNLIQAIKTKTLTEEVIVNYLESKELVSFEEQLDDIFFIFYNNFSMTEVAQDTDFIFNVLELLPSYENILVANEDGALDEEISLKKQIMHAYTNLIVFINGTLNDTLMLLDDKIDQLLLIDYKILPQTQAKKYYLYYLLNILLAQPIKDIELIQEITNELKAYK